jgi:hypothetical protein
MVMQKEIYAEHRPVICKLSMRVRREKNKAWLFDGWRSSLRDEDTTSIFGHVINITG